MDVQTDMTWWQKPWPHIPNAPIYHTNAAMHRYRPLGKKCDYMHYSFFFVAYDQEKTSSTRSCKHNDHYQPSTSQTFHYTLLHSDNHLTIGSIHSHISCGLQYPKTIWPFDHTIWPSNHYHLTIWPPSDCYLTTIWPSDHLTIIIWPSDCYYLTIWPPSDHYLTNIWPTSDHYLTTIWS